MKKLIKKFFVLLCVTTMLAAPISALAANEPTLLYIDSARDTQVWSYQPTACYFSRGNGVPPLLSLHILRH